VEINGNTPAGYDTVDCGTAQANGATIAVQIQTSLRALVDPSSKTGYADVAVSFDAALNKFTVTSQEYGAISSVQVTAGAEKDASVVLGFDNPVEDRGVRIVTVDFDTIQPVDDVYPITYRTIPFVVREEVYVY
jgi:Flp pilus assembly protein TadG